jgi:hypothetical protein
MIRATIMSIIEFCAAHGRRAVVLGSAVAALGCFTKDDVKGLLCITDDHCGNLLKCEQGVCGGIDQEYGADPCATGVDECADVDTLSRCAGGQVFEGSCSQYCSSLGLPEAFGCFYTSPGGDGQCYCREDVSPCNDVGLRECTSSGRNLKECVNSYTQITDCDKYCSTLGLDTLGCSESDGIAQCQCHQTTTCSNWQARYCLDDLTMVECVDGSWSEVLCSNACPQGLALGCGYRSADDDFTCLCAY